MSRMPKYEDRPLHDRPTVCKLLMPGGKKVEAVRIHKPQDHPQVKRYPLTHKYSKAFYVSSSAGAIDATVPLRLGEFFVVDVGHKVSSFDKQVVGWWDRNLSAVEVTK